MGITRRLPQSITATIKALNTAKAKKDGAVIPADNILSDATSARLDTDIAAYNAGKASIVAAWQVFHKAVELAKPQRKLLRKYIKSFYASVNNCIDLNTILASARAFYGLEISNKKMPNMRTDATLLAAAALLLTGDAARIADGGIAIASPTIAEITTIINDATPIIRAVSNAKTVVTTAISKLKKQNAEIKDLIKHIWNEIEAYYSLDDASSIRVQGRLWGMQFISIGVPSLISGLCTDRISGALLSDVQLYLVGVGKRAQSDADGSYIINTSLYDTLTLNAKLAGYDDFTLDFIKEDGVPLVVNVVMVKKIAV